MKPIEIRVTARSPKSPRELCAEFLDTDRWTEFEGYLFLPGVRRAEVETRTPVMVGTRIRVQNTDGSAHLEEIIEWDAPRRIAVKFGEFQPPLSHLATHFIEAWDFRETGAGTHVVRTMRMYPKSVFGWLALRLVAILMKRAFEKQMRVMKRKEWMA